MNASDLPPSSEPTTTASSVPPSTTLSTKKSSSVRPAFIVVLCITLVAAGLLYVAPDSLFMLQSKSKKNLEQNPQTTPMPTPTPIQLIQGKETYAVRQGTHDGPDISQVIFDPLDVHKGEKLTIIVTVSDATPIQNVTAQLQSDGRSQSVSFKKTQGMGTKSVWQGEITPQSTLWYTYILTIKATSAKGTSRAIVAPRS